MTGIELIDAILTAIAANLVTYQLSATGLSEWAYQTIKSRLKSVVRWVNARKAMKHQIAELEMASLKANDQRLEALSRAETAEVRAEKLARLLESTSKAYQEHIEYLEGEARQLRYRDDRP